MTRCPAPRPCGSCPYRRDVPSGVWVADEYAKLPAYDRPTAEQPPAVFLCHQQDGRVCAGWAGTHDMDDNLGLRLAASMGTMSSDDVRATLEYECPVPLWDSGLAAAKHGMAGVDDPSDAARMAMAKIDIKREARERRRDARLAERHL